MASVPSRLFEGWELALQEMSGVSLEGAQRGAYQGGFLNICRKGGHWALSVPLTDVCSHSPTLPCSVLSVPSAIPCSFARFPFPCPPGPSPCSLSLSPVPAPSPRSLLSTLLPAPPLFPHRELFPFTVPRPLRPFLVPTTLLSQDRKPREEAWGAVFCPTTSTCLPT